MLASGLQSGPAGASLGHPGPGVPLLQGGAGWRHDDHTRWGLKTTFYEFVSCSWFLTYLRCLCHLQLVYLRWRLGVRIGFKSFPIHEGVAKVLEVQLAPWLEFLVSHGGLEMVGWHDDVAASSWGITHTIGCCGSSFWLLIRQSVFKLNVIWSCCDRNWQPLYLAVFELPRMGRYITEFWSLSTHFCIVYYWSFDIMNIQIFQRISSCKLTLKVRWQIRI